MTARVLFSFGLMVTLSLLFTQEARAVNCTQADNACQTLSSCFGKCSPGGKCTFQGVKGNCLARVGFPNCCYCSAASSCFIPNEGCQQGLLEQECLDLGGTFSTDGPCFVIPATSRWGLVVMGLLLLTAITLGVYRLRARAA